jgi:ribonuclease J
MYSFIEEDYKIVASDEVLVYDSDFKKIDIKDEFILFNSYIMNVQRLGYYYDIAKRYNKQLVLTNKNASLFKKYFNEDFLELDVDITFDVLNKQVNKYIIDFDYNNKEDYKDLIGSKTILHMGGEPLGDYDPRYKVYLDFCKTYDFKLLVTGCGGHATVENLKYVLNNINHKFLYPLHSFKPELIKSDNSEQILPSINEEFIFIDHNLEK